MHTEGNLFRSVTVDKKSGAVTTTNALQSWSYVVPIALLPGNGVELPDIRLRAPRFGMEGPPIGILIRAKDSDSETIAFRPLLFPDAFLWTNQLRQPVVVNGSRTAEGDVTFKISPDMFKDMR